MKIVTIIQARMGSSRLPGKVLMDLGGDTVLSRVVRRSCRAKLTTQTIVATTSLAKDDVVASECERLGVAVFRGSETNVLDRYYQAALQHQAAIVVRVTADNPLVDPDLIDDVVLAILTSHADYVNNRSPRLYPQGLDVEAFTFVALQQAWRQAMKQYEQEHVTPYFYEHPELFDCVSVRGPFDCSHYRWTLDTAEDLRVIREIYSHLGNSDGFSWNEALIVAERGISLQGVTHLAQESV